MFIFQFTLPNKGLDLDGCIVPSLHPFAAHAHDREEGDPAGRGQRERVAAVADAARLDEQPALAPPRPRPADQSHPFFLGGEGDDLHPVVRLAPRDERRMSGIGDLGDEGEALVAKHLEEVPAPVGAFSGVHAGSSHRASRRRRGPSEQRAADKVPRLRETHPGAGPGRPGNGSGRIMRRRLRRVPRRFPPAPGDCAFGPGCPATGRRSAPDSGPGRPEALAPAPGDLRPRPGGAVVIRAEPLIAGDVLIAVIAVVVAVMELVVEGTEHEDRSSPEGQRLEARV